MTNWEKGKAARARRAEHLRGEMDSMIARIEAGEDLIAEFHDLFQIARRYITNRDGLGTYYKRYLIAGRNVVR